MSRKIDEIRRAFGCLTEVSKCVDGTVAISPLDAAPGKLIVVEVFVDGSFSIVHEPAADEKVLVALRAIVSLA